MNHILMMKSELLDRTGHTRTNALISKTLKKAHPVVIVAADKTQAPQLRFLVPGDECLTQAMSKARLYADTVHLDLTE